MDGLAESEFRRLGIDPDTIPMGTASLVKADQYKAFGGRAFAWSINSQNDPAIAYEVETEHQRGVGVILRNLWPRSRGGAHLMLKPPEIDVPTWHNFSSAISHIWSSGIALLVEGPKDARVLWSNGIFPVVAYLGQAPSTKHLTCLRRYTKTILWYPDNDPDMVL